MSYLEDIKLNHEVYRFNVDERIKYSLSVEGISFRNVLSGIKILVKKLVDFFKSVFRWIKEVVYKWFKGKTVNRIITESKRTRTLLEITNRPYIINLEESYTEVISKEAIKLDNESSFNTEVTRSKLRAVYKPWGGLFDIDEIYNGIKEYKETKFTSILNKQGLLLEDYYYHTPENDRLETTQHGAQGMGDWVAEKINGWDHVKIGLHKRRPFTIGGQDFYKYVDALPGLFKAAERFYNVEHYSVDRFIKYLEHGIKTADEKYIYTVDMGRYKGTLNVYYSYLKVILIPFNVLSMYIRLLEKHNREFMYSGKYLTTPYTDATTLFHVSELKLDLSSTSVFEPRITSNNRYQFLPARISFSPTIEGCCFGIPDTVWRYPDETYTNDRKETLYVKTLYVYQGLPDSHTRYLDQKLVDYFVGESLYSKEVCVVTPIKVKEHSVIKVTYRPTLPVYDHNRIVKIETI